MAKAQYIGVGNVARKVKKQYIGVGGIARKIKKGYIGVGGVARQYWSSGTPLTLYDNGSKPYAYTLAKYTSGPSITSSYEDKSTYVRLYATGKMAGWGTGNPAGAVMLFQNIDLTNYSKLCVEAELKTLTVYDNSCFDVSVGNAVNSYGYIGDREAKTEVKSSSTTAKQIVTVDISALTGKKHIQVRANIATPNTTSTVDAYVYKIYLEP